MLGTRQASNRLSLLLTMCYIAPTYRGHCNTRQYHSISSSDVVLWLLGAWACWDIHPSCGRFPLASHERVSLSARRRSFLAEQPPPLAVYFWLQCLKKRRYKIAGCRPCASCSERTPRNPGVALCGGRALFGGQAIPDARVVPSRHVQ